MKKFLFLLLFLLPSGAQAQQIPIKTIPLATGYQFLVFPSENLAMGGVSIALDDPLGDLFVNPAKGSVVGGLQFLTAPASYSIYPTNSGRVGSVGRTLPFGLIFGGKEYFGGLMLARQGLTLNSERTGSPRISPAIPFSSSVRIGDEGDERANNYSLALIGRKFDEIGLSAGGSVFWGDLNAMEGVQYLYPRASELNQSGTLVDVRFGLAGQLEENRSYEAIVSYQRIEMRYEILNEYVIPLPGDQTPNGYEVHRDVTSGWGLKLGYQQPMGGTWRVGAMLVGNWKSHPKIPNYELMNIPRDPGFSRAYHFGAGVSTTRKRFVFGVDVIYEPITSETWAEAEAPVQAPSGRIIPIGGRTVENFFNFHNNIVRVGVRNFGDRTDVQFGVQRRAMKYYLRQINHQLEFQRRQKEEWTEWTISLGVGFPFLGTKVRYTGLLTTGTGQPGVSRGGLWAPGDVVTLAGMGDSSGNFVLAPSGPLSLNEAWVLAHQVSIVVPIL